MTLENLPEIIGKPFQKGRQSSAIEKIAKDKLEIACIKQVIEKNTKSNAELEEAMGDLEKKCSPGKLSAGEHHENNRDGWKMLMLFIRQQSDATTNILINQAHLFERVERLETSVGEQLKEINTTASKQVLPIQAPTYASIAGGEKPNETQPITRNRLHHVVDVNELQRKQDQEGEKCSKEVVMDVKAFTKGDELEGVDASEITSVIGEILTGLDKDMNIEQDLHSANVIEGHKEKPYLIKFKSKQAATRLLAAAKKSSVPFKQLRPSRTRVEREKLRQDWALRQKENSGREKNEQGEYVKKPRGSKFLYFNPKPDESRSKETLDGEGATATTTGVQSKTGDSAKADVDVSDNQTTNQ